MPRGGSVNDVISKVAWSLHYVSIDHIAVRMVELGRDTLLGKMNISRHTGIS